MMVVTNSNNDGGDGDGGEGDDSGDRGSHDCCHGDGDSYLNGDDLSRWIINFL